MQGMKSDADSKSIDPRRQMESEAHAVEVAHFLTSNAIGDPEAVAEWLAQGSEAVLDELEAILTAEEYQALLDYLQTSDDLA